MHRFISLLITFLMGSALSSSICQAQIPSNARIQKPNLAKQFKYLKLIASRYSSHASLIRYGTSVRGRPLYAIKITSPSAQEHPGPKPAVLITGTTHGNEYLDIVPRLALHFAKKQPTLSPAREFLNAGGSLIIIPFVNPDGYANNTRNNANDVDLNREFTLTPNQPQLRQPETQSLLNFLQSELQHHDLQLLLSMDYHCCNGSLLFPRSFRHKPHSALDKSRLRLVAESMQETLGKDYVFGTTIKVLGYQASGTSKDYYYASFGAQAFTFEGKERLENRNIEKHKRWWGKILKHLTQANKNLSH